jgi:hypothetical protein
MVRAVRRFSVSDLPDLARVVRSAGSQRSSTEQIVSSAASSEVVRGLDDVFETAPDRRGGLLMLRRRADAGTSQCVSDSRASPSASGPSSTTRPAESRATRGTG